MKYFDWDDAKNAKLRAERGIGFEDIVFHIERGDLLDILEHPNPDRYAGQRIFVVRREEYVYLVEVQEENERLRAELARIERDRHVLEAERLENRRLRSLLQLRERVNRTVQDLAARHPGEQIVVVAHGGVLDTLYRIATGQEVNSPRTWQLPNGAINRLLWTPQGFTLVGWSDTQHLEHAAADENTSF